VGCGGANEKGRARGLAGWSKAVPLSPFQAKVAKLLAANRSPDSHLAGGAALHIAPNSLRYSNDLDYFHDSEERVAKAFEDDLQLLKKSSFSLQVEVRLSGYIRAQVSKAKGSTKVEWAHDSAWRFMPVIQQEDCGYMLHPIDLAINKVLTLAGRNEPRDLIDTLEVHRKILPLGALCWAAAGKDPGFNPRSLLELLKRRGRFRAEDFSRLQLKKPVDLEDLKARWLTAIEDAESFIGSRPPDELGCLYYSERECDFIAPKLSDEKTKDYQLHYGRPGGVLPQVITES